MQPAQLARRLWEAIEPLHDVVYFHPEPTDVLIRIGLKGWWMCYFAGRFAPLGAVDPGPVTAMAFGFAPAMVARALPDAWALASPAEVLPARLGGVAEALREVLPAGAATEELADLLSDAVAACRYEGRP